MSEQEVYFFQTYFFFSDSGYDEQLSKKYTFFDEKKNIIFTIEVYVRIAVTYLLDV